MKDSKTITTTLSNGLRCAVRMQPESRVSYTGIIANAGSREDPEHLPGLAHFVEHTIFKGTTSRSSRQVSTRMESVGGELNAYTGREETAVYVNAPARYTARAMELLADLVANATFPTEEIEREKDVVIEEINSYLDSPFESVYDDFDDLIYKGSAIGHNVLGNAESVRRITREDCRRFLDDYYVPENMVVYSVGPDDPEKTLRIIEKTICHFQGAGKPLNRQIPPMNARFSELRDRDGHQSHTIFGTRLFGRTDPRRFALFLLTNYLGGPAMSSVLNEQLREKRGLVYTVDAITSLLSDCGTMTIYFGSDRNDLAKCLRLVKKELKRLAERPISSAWLERIKRQYTGQLLLGAENRESRAQAMGKALLYYGNCHDIEWTIDRINEITPTHVAEVAELLNPENFDCLTLC